MLLVNDAAWVAAAREGLESTGGGKLDLAKSAKSALHTLVQPDNPFTHLLMQPSAAGPMLRDLLGVTAGETGSQVGLVLLGEPAALPGVRGVLRAGTPADLRGLLAREAITSPALPSLSTSELAVAFSPQDVECRFQPIVRLDDRHPVGVETLVRLRHPDRGTIGPDLFIPQIERAGLSLRLTEAVAKCAMATIDPALLEHHRLFVSINLPLDVLLFPEALDRIDTLRARYGISVDRLLIELTESRPVHDIPALQTALLAWRAAGYRVAIDDMGPEMLNQLELFDLPFNVVKLDKQIVLRSEKDELARRYLQHTVRNAKLRNLTVIAEGIENVAMWTRMRELGVQQAQGFLIARALPASALAAWLEAWSAQLALPRDRS